MNVSLLNIIHSKIIHLTVQFEGKYREREKLRSAKDLLSGIVAFQMNKGAKSIMEPLQS